MLPSSGLLDFAQPFLADTDLLDEMASAIEKELGVPFDEGIKTAHVDDTKMRGFLSVRNKMLGTAIDHENHDNVNAEDRDQVALLDNTGVDVVDKADDQVPETPS